MSLRLTDELGHELTYAADNTIPSLSLLGAIDGAQGDARLLVTQHVLAPDDAQKRDIEQKLTAKVTEIDGMIASYEPLVSDQTDRADFNQVKTLWNDWKDHSQRTRQLSASLEDLRAVAPKVRDKMKKPAAMRRAEGPKRSSIQP